MSQVTFKPMIPAFEWARTFSALDCTTIAIGFIFCTLVKVSQGLTHYERKALKNEVYYILEFVLDIHLEMFLHILIDSLRFICQSAFKFDVQREIKCFRIVLCMLIT
jgi:hypothetical protein